VEKTPEKYTFVLRTTFPIRQVLKTKFRETLKRKQIGIGTTQLKSARSSSKRRSANAFPVPLLSFADAGPLHERLQEGSSLD
jgi:hypothetical protein